MKRKRVESVITALDSIQHSTEEARMMAASQPVFSP